MVPIAQRGIATMGNSDVFATFGVPIFYIDTVVAEDAGDGMTRVWNCATRNGILVPQCEIIARTTRLVVMTTNVRDATRDFMQKEMLRERVH